MGLGLYTVDSRAVWHLADGSRCQMIGPTIMWSVEYRVVSAKQSHSRIRYWMNRLRGALARERMDLAERTTRAAVTDIGDSRMKNRRADARRRGWVAAMGRTGDAIRAWQAHPSRYTSGRVTVATDRLVRAYLVVPPR